MLQFHCIETLADIGAVAQVCDSIPEGNPVSNQTPSREVIADGDLVNRTFLFMACQRSGAGQNAPSLGGLCDNALAQAPILCLQQVAVESAFQESHCTCWPRLDTKGLSTSPSQGQIGSISEKFPLDQEYPTTPRTYGGTYPT